MYAVIQAGGKQERVFPGQQVRVELVESARRAEGTGLELAPVLVVDGARVLATPEELADVVVSARVVGEELGVKVRGFTYKPKTRSRRRWGHRQRYTTLEITGIQVPASR